KKLSGFYAKSAERESYQGMLNTINEIPKETEYSYLLPKYLLSLKVENIIEVGCGNGRVYRQLRHFGYSGLYTGLDVPEYVISSNQARHPESTWIAGKVYSIPFDNN